MKFKELTDLVSQDKVVLLETSVLLNYINFGNNNETVEKSMECIQARVDFYRFLRRHLPELKNWYVIPQTIEETNVNEGYPYKKIIQRKDSFNHKYNIVISAKERRLDLEYLRKRRQEKQELRKLMNYFESENQVLLLDSKEQELAESLDCHYRPLKPKIGVEALSEADWNFMISGLAVAKVNGGNVSLISNDSVMIPFWKHASIAEHLNHKKFKFILRKDFLRFTKLTYNPQQM